MQGKGEKRGKQAGMKGRERGKRRRREGEMVEPPVHISGYVTGK